MRQCRVCGNPTDNKVNISYCPTPICQQCIEEIGKHWQSGEKLHSWVTCEHSDCDCDEDTGCQNDDSFDTGVVK